MSNNSQIVLLPSLLHIYLSCQQITKARNMKNFNLQRTKIIKYTWLTIMRFSFQQDFYGQPVLTWNRTKRWEIPFVSVLLPSW